MEAELTEAYKINPNTDNSAVTDDANFDEAITSEARASSKMEMFLQKERTNQAYKKTMNIDIENINTFEKRNREYTPKQRIIYEVIEPDFFNKSDIFPDNFIKKCRDNAN